MSWANPDISRLDNKQWCRTSPEHDTIVYASFLGDGAIVRSPHRVESTAGSSVFAAGD